MDEKGEHRASLEGFVGSALKRRIDDDLAQARRGLGLGRYGEAFEKLFENEELAYQMLHSKDSISRAMAIEFLICTNQYSDAFLELCLNYSKHDSDIQVRIISIHYISLRLFRTDDERLFNHLTSIVGDSSEMSEVKKKARTMVAILLGKSLEEVIEDVLGLDAEPGHRNKVTEILNEARGKSGEARPASEA